jgi:acetyl esterase/lipase
VPSPDAAHARKLARPPYDPELAAVLDRLRDILPPTITPDLIGARRAASITDPALVAGILEARDLVQRDVVVARDGRPDLVLSVFTRADHVAGGPGFYNMHGGGMIMGDRFRGIDFALEWVQLMDAVAVTVEYRLAPETPDPGPVDDSYDGLTWMAQHSEELGFDPARLVVMGASAGGGLAAGVTLRARDLGTPAIAGQVLIYPMLDDRNETVSSHQFVGIGVWDRGSNDTGWDALLGDRRNTDAVSRYAAPSRETDLSGLPPTSIDVGSAEVFRDECVAFASAIWAAGGECELHVWPGAFHAFDFAVPTAALSRASRETRTDWVRRLLGA